MITIKNSYTRIGGINLWESIENTVAIWRRDGMLHNTAVLARKFMIDYAAYRIYGDDTVGIPAGLSFVEYRDWAGAVDALIVKWGIDTAN